MMEPLGHISEYGLEKLKTRRHYCVSVSHKPEKEYTIGIVRLSDAEARIAELRAAIFGSANYHEDLKHEAFVSMGQMLHDCLKMAREKAEAAEARAEAAEALLKEADTLAKIAIGAEKMMNGAAIYFAADGERDDAKKLTKVATIMGEHARALRSKIGVKDE